MITMIRWFSPAFAYTTIFFALDPNLWWLQDERARVTRALKSPINFDSNFLLFSFFGRDHYLQNTRTTVLSLKLLLFEGVNFFAMWWMWYVLCEMLDENVRISSACWTPLMMSANWAPINHSMLIDLGLFLSRKKYLKNLMGLRAGGKKWETLFCACDRWLRLECLSWGRFKRQNTTLHH